MYHNIPDPDNPDVSQSGFQSSDNNSYFDSSEYRYNNKHTYPPQHHQSHFYQPYPTSAPAVPTASDDYFSYSLELQQIETDVREFYPSLFKSDVAIVHKDSGKSQNAKLAKAGHMVDKVRRRSNLSQSYSNADSYDHPHATSEPESNFQHNQPKMGLRFTQPRRNNRNPGFHLELDDLHAPNALQTFQLLILANTHSGSNFEMTYNNMRIMDPDIYLQNSGNGDLDKGQENITPLMNPPQTTENDYFGGSGTPGLSQNVENTMPGGYLIVPQNAKKEDSGNSDTNSEFGDYLNIPVDEVEDLYDHPNEANGKDQGAFQNHLLSSISYYETDETTRARATFIPLMYGSGHEGEHAYMAHSDHELRPQLGVQRPEVEHQDFKSLESQLPHNHELSHHQQSDRHQQAGVQQQENIHQQENIQQQENIHQQASIHQQAGVHQQESIHQQPGSQLQASIHQQPGSQQQIGRYQQSGGSVALHHEQQAENQQIQFQNHNQESQQLHNQPQTARLHIPVRPELERSVSAPGSSHPSKMSDKKLSVKKKKAPKGTICSICDRFISRDFSRHMRIHNELGRFQCMFPRSYCKHRSGKFNRPYDYKKHLLNMHFNFDDPSAKTAVNLTDKLNVPGQCNACGQKFIANDWLDQHILTKDLSKKCAELQRLEQVFSEETIDKIRASKLLEDRLLEDKLLEDRLIDEDYDEST